MWYCPINESKNPLIDWILFQPAAGESAHVALSQPSNSFFFLLSFYGTSAYRKKKNSRYTEKISFDNLQFIYMGQFLNCVLPLEIHN